jgi:Domain of unknown function (DUF4372)/Transposase DDE domain
MNLGKTLFAQVMDFLPWKTFHRIVARRGGDKRVRTLTCAEQYRAMAFAQLTYRESLRDIEACLVAQAAKLYHMGFREPVARSTLADANELRDWRIWADFAGRLISQARALYAREDLGLDLSNTVYALDSTTIDLCLALFPWANFRATKAAVKMHTLLDLKGSIPSFLHISDGTLHDVHALDLLTPEPGAIYVMDRGYLDFTRLHALHLAGAFFVTRAKIEPQGASRVLDADRSQDRHRLRSAHRPGWLLRQTELSGTSAAGPIQRSGNRQGTGVPFQSDDLASGHDLRALQESLAGRTVLQVDQAASSDQTVLRYVGKCGQDANLDRGVGVCAGCHHQEAAESGCLALHTSTDLVRHNFREDALAASVSGRRLQYA